MPLRLKSSSAQGCTVTSGAGLPRTHCGPRRPGHTAPLVLKGCGKEPGGACSRPPEESRPRSQPVLRVAGWPCLAAHSRATSKFSSLAGATVCGPTRGRPLSLFSEVGRQ